MSLVTRHRSLYIVTGFGRAENRFLRFVGGGGKSEHRRARCRVTCSRRCCIGGFFEIHAGGEAARPADGKCHREHTADFGVSNLKFQRARVKRWGKSPPLQPQARRHGKPHRVQGQIGNPGAARSRFRESGMGSGYWLLRQMILTPEAIRGRQNSAYSPSKTAFILLRGFAKNQQRCLVLFVLASDFKAFRKRERRGSPGRAILLGAPTACFRRNGRTNYCLAEPSFPLSAMPRFLKASGYSGLSFRAS